MNAFRISAVIGVLVVLSIGVGVAQDTKGKANSGQVAAGASKDSQMYAQPTRPPAIVKTMAIETPMTPKTSTIVTPTTPKKSNH